MEFSKSRLARFVPSVMLYGISAAIGCAIVLVVAFDGTAEAASGDLPTSPSGTVAEDLVKELASKPTGESPALPDLLVPANVGDGGLAMESVRFAGASKSRMVWLGKDDAGNVCAVLHSVVGDVTSTACSSPDFFAVHGLSLAVRGMAPGSYAETYIVPDGTDVNSSADSGLSEVSPNTFVGDTREAGSSTADVFRFPEGSPVNISLTRITDEEMRAGR